MARQRRRNASSCSELQLAAKLARPSQRVPSAPPARLFMAIVKLRLAALCCRIMARLERKTSFRRWYSARDACERWAPWEARKASYCGGDGGREG